MNQPKPRKARSPDYPNAIFAWVCIALLIIIAFAQSVATSATTDSPFELAAILLSLALNVIITLVLIIVFIFINKGKKRPKKSIFWLALCMIIINALAPFLIWPLLP